MYRDRQNARDILAVRRLCLVSNSGFHAVSADSEHHFGVWAPNAGRVELLADRRAARLSRGTAGWWSVEVDGAGPGTDYRLSVDGSVGLPDPRSAWQPEGVHGPSRVVDHAGFRWTDQEW